MEQPPSSVDYGAAGRTDDRQLKTENRKRVKPFGRLRAGRRRKTEARRPGGQKAGKQE